VLTGTRMTKTSRTKKFVVAAVTAAVLIVPFSLYYFVFVSTQTTYFTSRNLRVLSGISGQVKSKVEGIAGYVINAAKKEGPDDNLQSVEQVGARLAKKFRLISYGTEITPDLSTVVLDNASKVDPKPQVTVAIQPEGDSSIFAFDYSWLGRKESLPINFRARSRADQLFEPFITRFVQDAEINGTEHLFDRVLVAEADSGRVIFQEGEGGIRLLNIRELLRSNQQASKSSEPAETSADKESDKKSSDKKPAGGSGSHDLSTGTFNVDLAGSGYKLFIQPELLNIPRTGSASDQGIPILVCGLTRLDHFHDETFAVSYTVILLFVFVVALSCLGWPLLKLRFMGAKDRLKPVDVLCTAASALLGTSLLALLVLDIHSYISSEKRLDDQMEALSAKIKQNLNAELLQVMRQMTALNKELIGSVHKGVESSSPRAELAAEIDRASRQTVTPTNIKSTEKRLNVLETDKDVAAAPYPFFNSITWIDPEGAQRIKWTTREGVTPFINVLNRPYYYNAKAGNLWTVSLCQDDNEKGTCESHKFFIEPVRSRNSGENLAAVSTLVQGTDWVSAMDERLLSVFQPVLPEGYGFAIIDNSGLVQFDSNEVKNLDENIFEECNNDRLLRSVVKSRGSEFVNAQYLGRGHRFYISPMKYLPWTLIVCRDKQILRTTHLESTTLATAMTGGYWAIVLPALLLLFLTCSRRKLAWLWPDAAQGAAYRLIFSFNCVLAFIYCLLLLWLSNGAWVIFWSFVFPAAAIGHAIFVFWLNCREEKGRLMRFASSIAPSMDYRRAYPLAVTSFLLLLAALPTLASFKIIRDAEIRVFIKHGQMSIARRLEQRDDRINLQYSSVRIGEQNQLKRALINRRLNEPVLSSDGQSAYSSAPPSSDGRSPWDVYCSFFFDTHKNIGPDLEADDVDKSRSPLTWFLINFSPLYNETCVESHEMIRTASTDRSWSSEETPLRTLTLEKRREGHSDEAPVVLTSIVPKFMSPKNIGWWARLIIVALGFVAAVFFVVRFAARKIVLLDVEEPGPIFKLPASVQEIKENFLVVGAAAYESAARWPNGFEVVDLRELISDNHLQRLKYLSVPNGRPVLVDHFEFKAGDPTVNLTKLGFVERLVRDGRTVVVATSIDPLTNPFPLAAANGSAGSLPHAAATAASSSANGKAKDDNGDMTNGSTPNGRQDSNASPWNSVFASFVVVRQCNSTVQDDGDEIKALKAHGHTWKYLDTIIKKLKLHTNAGEVHLSDEELINQVADQAGAYHREIWSACTDDEKLALFHAAKDGLISQKNGEVRRLLQRRLLVRDPKLRLMDESFRRFVLANCPAHKVESWVKGETSHWETLKGPILLVVLGVAVFLLLTQKNVYDSSISFLSALTGGLAALLKLIGLFQKNRSSASE